MLNGKVVLFCYTVVMDKVEGAVLEKITNGLKKLLVKHDLTDKKFKFSVGSYSKPSKVLDIAWANREKFTALGMTEYGWEDGSVFSESKIAGERIVLYVYPL